MPETPNTRTEEPRPLFDRSLVRARRNRAARSFGEFDFLLARVEEEFADRIASFVAGPRPEGFGLVLEIASYKGSAHRVLAGAGTSADLIVSSDLGEAMLPSEGLRVVASDELVPFAEESFDLILAPLSLHFANDLPGALIQLRRLLKPGGVFLTALFGGETLGLLRQSLAQAELALDDGMSPRVIPFADIKDFGGLLQRAGFHDPVSDFDKVDVSYGSLASLMRDLRGMGLTNPMIKRRRDPPARRFFELTETLYREAAGSSEALPAQFQVLFGTGQAAPR